ncbi:MAG: Tfp pilus assembly protein FimT/FimU [Kiritimatiellia bacterium]
MTDKRGFTLMELMIAIAIMVVIMAYGGFNFVKMAPKRRLSGASFDITTALRQARMRAASGNTTAKVTFAGNTVTVWVDYDKDGVADAGESYTKTIDSKITFTKYPDTGTFNSRGMFESSYLYMYMTLYLANAGYQYIYVFPSGQVEMYNYY